MRINFFVCACLLANLSFGQETSWTVSEISASFGTHKHHVSQRASERAFALAPTSVIPSQDLSGYTAEHTRKEAAHFTSIQVHLVQDAPAAYELIRELRMGLHIHLDRTGGVQYKKKSTTSQGVLTEQWMARISEDELGINLDHLWRKHFNNLSVYTGVGGNVGLVLGGEVQQTRLAYYANGASLSDELFPEANTTFEAENALYIRATFPFGVSYSLGQFGVGAEYGVGASLNKIGPESRLFANSSLTLRIGMEIGS